MAFIERTWTGFTSVDDALAKVKQALIDAGWTDMSYGTPTVHMLATPVVATKQDKTQCIVYLELRKENVGGVDVLNAYFWQYPNKTGSSHGFGLPITADNLIDSFQFYSNEFWFAIYASSYTIYPTVAGAYVPLPNQKIDDFSLNPWHRTAFRDTTSNVFNRTHPDSGFSAVGGFYVCFVNIGITSWRFSPYEDFYLARTFKALPSYLLSDSSKPLFLYLYPILGNSNTGVGYLPYGGETVLGGNLGDTVVIGNFTFKAVAKDQQGCVLWGRVQ